MNRYNKYILFLNVLDLEGQTSLQHQLRKVLEEVKETEQELMLFKREDENTGDRLIEESLDVLQASLTLTRLIFDVFGKNKVDEAIKKHRMKMFDRKYDLCGNCYIELEIKENV